MRKHFIKDRSRPLAIVIDDDISMRFSIQAALEKYGLDVKSAENGKEGLQLIIEDLPDLILLDVVMPLMDGFETCRTIRSLPGNDYTQVLMVTGLDDNESIEKAFQAGANGFVTKPLNWTMLSHEVKYMLRAGKAFKELSKSKNRLVKTQNMAKLGSWEIHLNSQKFHCSESARALHGVLHVAENIDYLDFFSTIREEDRTGVIERVNRAIDLQEPFSINYQLSPQTGTPRYILNQGELLYNDKNEAEVLFCSVQDVTELKLAEEEIRTLAFYDSLTGLANRMFFLSRLEQELAYAHRHDQTVALLYLDLDQFKNINDSFGHHVGDMLLKKVAEILRQCIRSTDLVSRMEGRPEETLIARLGGDEFTIILSGIERPDNAAMVARRILEMINTTFSLDGEQVTTSTSIGISIYPTDGEDASILLKHADTAMYQAKKQGRNNYQFFIEKLNAQAQARFKLEMGIPVAFENDEFELHYQPKHNVQTGELVGAEALIRWNHPEKGYISPSLFIPIAEESGQIDLINEWVITIGCRQWQKWISDGFYPGLLSVNLSGYKFGQQPVLKNLDAILVECALSPNYLEIEITENILMREAKETMQAFEKLQRLGIRIAIDDFGTGYSSLSYLTSFHVDTLKIDRSFVSNCLTKPKSLVIVKAIVAMGQSLGMKVVAEGVETESDLEFIRQITVDEAQGFYFSKAMPAETFTEYLSKMEKDQKGKSGMAKIAAS